MNLKWRLVGRGRVRSYVFRWTVLVCWFFSNATLEAQTLSASLPDGYVAQNVLTQSRLMRYLNEYHLPSLSLAIRIQDKIVFAEAMGMANVSGEVPATVTTRYAVGSLAKPMTTAALMRLVQDRKLSLDDSIHQHVPDYPKENGGFTIRQLASHTAGIRHMTPGRWRKEWMQPQKHLHPHEALDFFMEEKLLFVPGTSFVYSSSGYVLLSDVIAKASGKPFIEAMQELVFDPLEMLHTEHDIEGAGAGQEASYYRGFEDGKFVPAATRRDRSFLFGGGGYLSTPTDLVNMAQGMSNAEYLSPELRQQLFTPVKLQNGDNNPQNYALGWRIDTRTIPVVNGAPVTGVHHGGIVSGAATAYLLFFPAYEASVALATNCVPPGKRNAELRDEMWDLLSMYVEPTQ